MTLTVGELWKSIRGFPAIINYYNETENEEATITDWAEMQEFMTAHSDAEIIEFEIIECFRAEGLVLNLNIKKRGETDE